MAAADVGFPSQGDMEDSNSVEIFEVGEYDSPSEDRFGCKHLESGIFVTATREVLEAHGIEWNMIQ